MQHNGFGARLSFAPASFAARPLSRSEYGPGLFEIPRGRMLAQELQPHYSGAIILRLNAPHKRKDAVTRIRVAVCPQLERHRNHQMDDGAESNVSTDSHSKTQSGYVDCFGDLRPFRSSRIIRSDPSGNPQPESLASAAFVLTHF